MGLGSLILLQFTEQWTPTTCTVCTYGRDGIHFDTSILLHFTTLYISLLLQFTTLYISLLLQFTTLYISLLLHFTLLHFNTSVYSSFTAAELRPAMWTLESSLTGGHPLRYPVSAHCPCSVPDCTGQQTRATDGAPQAERCAEESDRAGGEPPMDSVSTSRHYSTWTQLSVFCNAYFRRTMCNQCCMYCINVSSMLYVLY